MSRKKERTPVLTGKKALIVGIANDNSIAYGCAKAFNELGADLAVTYLNEKAQAACRAAGQGARGTDLRAARCIAGRANSRRSSQRIEKEWGQLDILVHSIASAKKEDIKGGLLNCSADGFAHGDGHFGAFVHPHGQAGGAADEGRRHDVRDELSRRDARSSPTTT